MDLEFQGKYILRGRLTCITGLHIGGTTQGIEIGGMDNPVIKDPLTEWPYVPGSSLKGKLRSLLEWSLGKIRPNPEQSTKDKDFYGAHFCGECEACVLFGPATNETERRVAAGPTRLTVRDLFPTRETLGKWAEWLGEEIYTEVKTENAIDRVTSEANPRSMERVPAGSEFTVEMILDMYREDDVNLFRNLFTAMRLLEHSALGGSGSRGYGQVLFKDLTIEWRPLEYYRNGTGVRLLELPGDTPELLLAGFDRIQWKG